MGGREEVVDRSRKGGVAEVESREAEVGPRAYSSACSGSREPPSRSRQPRGKIFTSEEEMFHKASSEECACLIPLTFR